MSIFISLESCESTKSGQEGDRLLSITFLAPLITQREKDLQLQFHLKKVTGGLPPFMVALPLAILRLPQSLITTPATKDIIDFMVKAGYLGEEIRTLIRPGFVPR